MNRNHHQRHRDFAIGRRIENLAQLRKIAFAANRRLLDVRRISHDCFIGEDALKDLQRPVIVEDQRRGTALRRSCPSHGRSAPPKSPSTTGANMQNLQPKNLTQLVNKVFGV